MEQINIRYRLNHHRDTKTNNISKKGEIHEKNRKYSFGHHACFYNAQCMYTSRENS